MAAQRFHGGLDLPGHKDESTGEGLRPIAAPARLRVSLLQHAGLPAEPCVAVGDVVARGQVIATAAPGAGAPVHSPLPGRVLELQSLALPGAPAVAVPHLVIGVTPDGAETMMAPLDPDADIEVLRSRLHEAGLVGLGGAGFPTAEKLAARRAILVLNGAECEPWIACDDALLREQARDVVRGAVLMARIAGADEVLLAVEDSMVAAREACAHAIAGVADERVRLVEVPTRYPQGGERQLIQVLTGREVPRGGLPRDIGVVVVNVGTAHAAWRAVAQGQPLIERVVTVTGPGVAQPGNFIVPIGTPVSHLVAQAGGYTPAARRLLLGGPMMGTALPHDDFPVGKTHHCILVLDAAQLPGPEPEMPCIRCGDCATVCPARLQPQQLLWFARAGRIDDAAEAGLFDCIECGCCDIVCPSRIPLTQAFRRAKGEALARRTEAARAEAARDRFESRQQRLAREAAEREARLAARKAAASPDAVAAALERAKARKAARRDPGGDE